MSRIHNPAHPGDVLREWIPAGMTVTDAANQLGISRVMLSKILNGKACLSADMALLLATWLGTTPEAWIDIQSTWDLWQEEQHPPLGVRPLRLAA